MCAAHYPNIVSFSEIEIDEPNSLVLLDINETLISYSDINNGRLFKNNNSDALKKCFDIIKQKALNVNEYTKIIDMAYKSTQTELLDDSFIEFHAKYHKSIPFMALTAIRPGLASPHDDEKVEDIWSNILHKNGVHLDTVYDTVFENVNEENPDLYHLKINERPKFHQLADAMIHNGIIFCCNLNKGFILMLLLNHLKKFNINVKNIVMVDDLQSNLLDMSNYLVCNYPHITFKGYHFVKENQIEQQLDYIDDNYVSNAADSFCQKYYSK